MLPTTSAGFAAAIIDEVILLVLADATAKDVQKGSQHARRFYLSGLMLALCSSCGFELD